MVVSEPDNLGTKKIKDKPLWTVGIPMETRSLSRCILALVSAISTCKHALAILKENCVTTNYSTKHAQVLKQNLLHNFY